MPGLWWVLGVMVALLMIVRFRGEFELDAAALAGLASGVVVTSPRVRAFAQAIAQAEGFSVVGSVASRARNPGNLKLGGPHTINGVTVFESDALGWSALYRQLGLIVDGRSAHYRVSMTIAQMGATWAPTGGADLNIAGAWARNVAAALRVPVTTRLGDVLT
jgi:hypothetical protein